MRLNSARYIFGRAIDVVYYDRRLQTRSLGRLPLNSSYKGQSTTVSVQNQIFYFVFALNVMTLPIIAYN